MKFSSVDVGSNAIRQIIVEIDPNESNAYRWKVIKKFRAPLRLGTDVFKYKELKTETLNQLVAIFKKIAKLNEKYKIDKGYVSATSALRDCKNKKTVLKKIKQETGLTINIITGQEEAAYIREAIIQTKLINFRNVLMIDIGGGSLELSTLKNLKLIKAQSMPLGVVRLLQHKKDLKKDWHKTADDHLHEYTKNLDPIDYDFAMGTGGNFDALSKLKILLLKSAPDTNLTYSEILEIWKTWKTLSLNQKIALDIRKDRIDVLDIAIPLIIQILNYFKIKHLKIPNTGLKEGVILSHL